MVVAQAMAQEFVSTRMIFVSVFTDSAVAVEVVAGNFLWNPVDDSQGSVWQAVDDSQTGSWNPVNDAQTTSWTAVDDTQGSSWSPVDDSQTTTWVDLDPDG